jgi:aarF domain-containing kinase
MSDANIRRLVATLGRMRGAALKLGQFMSIQGLSVFQSISLILC